MMGSNYNFHGPVQGQGHIFGDDARQENRFNAPPLAEERHRLIEELLQQISDHAADLRNHNELTATAEELDAELRQDEPRPGTLRRLVTNLTLGATGVTAVAEAVEKLRTALNL